MDNFTDLQGNNVNDFITNYRQSLADQRDASIAQAEQERTNQQAAIMSGANSMGMLYSNFPSRTKIQYDTNTYLPAVESAQTTYQSALDTLREKALSSYNTVESLKEAIAELNEA